MIFSGRVKKREKKIVNLDLCCWFDMFCGLKLDVVYPKTSMTIS